MKAHVHTFAASCVIRRKSTRFIGRKLPVARTGIVARGQDFIQTDAGKGIEVMDVVQKAINDRIFIRRTGHPAGGR